MASIVTGYQYRGSAAGPDVFRLAKDLAAWPEFGAPPISLDIDNGHPKVTSPGLSWFQRARRATRRVDIEWSTDETPIHEQRWLTINVRHAPNTVQWSIPSCIADENDIIRRLLPLPFTVAVAGLPDDPPYYDAYERLFPNQSRSVFHSGHFGAGLACLFRGEGHEQILVSRRWLDYGPWYTESLPNDTTYVQCCEITADPEIAVAQAATANKRLGYSDEGGVFVVGVHQIANSVRGIYDATDRSFTIVCGDGRVISQREMLDACAIKKRRRNDPREPIASMRFMFIEPADAHAHLHELWLRELECWTFNKDTGLPFRLDADYHPEPQKPEWVARVATRRAAGGA